MKGIHFLTNEYNEQIAVQIDLKLHGELWQDFYDRLLVTLRKDEECISLNDFMSELKKEGIINEI